MSRNAGGDHVPVPPPSAVDARRLVVLGATALGIGIVLIVLALTRHGLELHLVVGAGAIGATGLAVAVVGLRGLRR